MLFMYLTIFKNITVRVRDVKIIYTIILNNFTYLNSPFSQFLINDFHIAAAKADQGFLKSVIIG